MISYASTVPDSLGWGKVELQTSYGLLRVCFVLVSVQCALVANGIFHFWENETVVEAWNAFMKTRWATFKKALYIECTLQLIGYFLVRAAHPRELLALSRTLLGRRPPASHFAAAPRHATRCALFLRSVH